MPSDRHPGAVALDADAILARANNHRWQADQGRWSCEDDIRALVAQLAAVTAERDALRAEAAVLRDTEQELRSELADRAANDAVADGFPADVMAAVRNGHLPDDIRAECERAIAEHFARKVDVKKYEWNPEHAQVTTATASPPTGSPATMSDARMCSGCSACVDAVAWACLGCSALFKRCPDHDAENCPACGEKVAPVAIAIKAARTAARRELAGEIADRMDQIRDGDTGAYAALRSRLRSIAEGREP